MKLVDNIFFDFNGTIVDDVDLCLDILNQMLTMCNHKQVSKEAYLDVFSFPVQEYYQKAGFVFPQDDFSSLAKYFINQYTLNNNQCNLNEGIIEILEYLKSNHKKLYIVSASEINLLKSQLKDYGIDQYFIDVSGLDNISASSKIDSAKEFIKKKDIDPNKSIFIGDTLHDKEVADNLNMQCILVSKGHQSKKKLLEAKCLVLDDFLQLKDYL